MPSQMPVGSTILLFLLAVSAALADPPLAGPTGVRVVPLAVPAQGRAGFTLLSPADTGLAFTNVLLPEPEARNHNLLNGSGLAVGDYDGDGRCDVFLCSLNGSSALFRNLGGWKFTNVTVAAGLANTNQLARGAAFADVDGDGDLDLLVTYSGTGARLFLNQGNGRFADAQAAELVAETGSTSLALGDVDGDGDLDLYIANYGENTIRSGMRISTRVVGGREQVVGRMRNRLKILEGKLVEYGEPDALFLNDGRGRFAKVSWTGGAFRDETGAPLAAELWDMGLSAAIRDINQDGHPDIHVCNDFQNPDRFWLGDGRGGFRAMPRHAIRSTPNFSMSADFADFNGDGLLDFFNTDMVSRRHDLRMRQLAPASPPIEHTLERAPDRPQFRRNALFLNRGDGTYTETANFAGVAGSDWSWAVVCLDVDLDGQEDILVGTGHYYDTQDLDAIERTAQFSPAEKADGRKVLEAFPLLRIPNVAFRNRGDLTFEETGRAWGFDSPEVSHSLALADLDNDGDLDVVVNCLRAPALVYRNDSPAPRVAVRLKGLAPNTRGIGAWLRLTGGAAPVQIKEMMCGGHYLSGDDTVRVFAAGNSSGDMTLEVFWRSGRHTVVRGVKANHLYELEEAAAAGRASPLPVLPERSGSPLLRDDSAALKHQHRNEPFDDFAVQRLLPRRFSTLGPGVAWLDVDGDGREDLFVGAGRGGRLGAFRNEGQGRFTPLNWPALTEPQADDATAVVGAPLNLAGVTLFAGQAHYEATVGQTPRLRRFDFATDPAAITVSQPGLASPRPLNLASSPVPLPPPASPGPVVLADWDGDGDLDGFVGARLIRGRYPQSAGSWLLRNTDGRLEPDAAASEPFRAAGMVSGAVFADLNADGWPDLALACEWGPVRVFRNERGRFREATEELGLGAFTGWWNSVTAGDFDGDGRLDLVAGNWGENSAHHQVAPGPWSLYHGDLAGDGEVHLLEAYFDPVSQRELPWRQMVLLETDLPWLRAKYPTHLAYSRATVADLLAGRSPAPRRLEARQLASNVFLNRGDRFEPRPLPLEAQLAPAFGLVVGDFDGDGREDLFIAQGFFGVRPEDARLDAGRGLLLLGDGQGGFEAMRGQDSGVAIYEEQRGAAAADYDGDGRLDLVVTQHGDATVLLRNVGAKPGLRVRLVGGPTNPAGVGATLRLAFGERRGPAREVRAGGGYWSQDGFVQVLAAPESPTGLQVRWPGGEVRDYRLPPDAREVTAHASGQLEVKP